MIFLTGKKVRTKKPSLKQISTKRTTKLDSNDRFGHILNKFTLPEMSLRSSLKQPIANDSHQIFEIHDYNLKDFGIDEFGDGNNTQVHSKNIQYEDNLSKDTKREMEKDLEECIDIDYGGKRNKRSAEMKYQNRTVHEQNHVSNKNNTAKNHVISFLQQKYMEVYNKHHENHSKAITEDSDNSKKTTHQKNPVSHQNNTTKNNVINFLQQKFNEVYNKHHEGAIIEDLDHTQKTSQWYEVFTIKDYNYTGWRYNSTDGMKHYEVDQSRILYESEMSEETKRAIKEEEDNQNREMKKRQDEERQRQRRSILVTEKNEENVINKRHKRNILTDEEILKKYTKKINNIAVQKRFQQGVNKDTRGNLGMLDEGELNARYGKREQDFYKSASVITAESNEEVLQNLMGLEDKYDENVRKFMKK